MTVKELIQELKQYEDEIEVFYSSNYEDIYSIESVGNVEITYDTKSPIIWVNKQ